MSATGRDLYIDIPLSNTMVGRRPVGFIADQLLPVVPVTKQSGMYWARNRKETFEHIPNISFRAPKTAPKKVTWNVASDTYYAHNYALASDWAVEEEVNADAQLRYRETHAMNVTDKLMYDYEFRVSQLATTNIYTTTHVATAWSNKNATIFDDVMAQKEAFYVATGLEPNRMIIPRKHWRHIKVNSQIAQLIRGDAGGVPTVRAIQDLFEIEAVLIPQLLVNTAGEQETQNGSGSLGYVWGDKISFMHVNLLGGDMVDTWAQSFRWTNPSLGTPFAVERVPYDPVKKCEGIQAGYYQGEKVISSDLHWAIDSIS
jgi:hypothetical protein